MNKNRDKGHRWERKCMSLLKEVFPRVVTSRNESLTEDANGVDLCSTGGYAFQCKAVKNMPIGKFFEHMRTDKQKVILYKDTKHPHNQPEYAIMEMSTFMELINK